MAQKTQKFSNNCNFVYFQYKKKVMLTPKQPVINAVFITNIDYSITENYRVAKKERMFFFQIIVTLFIFNIKKLC